MSPVRYALLSLLAREKLTGYDLTHYLNQRLAPFWPVRYNQVYPELARLEEEGLVKHIVVEPDSYRPAKKIYEMTQAGIEVLRTWSMTSAEAAVNRDEFLLKMYNLWLLEPEQIIAQIKEQKRVHMQQAKSYEERIQGLKNEIPLKEYSYKEPLFSSIATLMFGLSYEQHYVDWCDSVLSMLQQQT